MPASIIRRECPTETSSSRLTSGLPSLSDFNKWLIIKNSTVGAGDTFIACVLYGLAHRCDWLNREAVLGFAVDTATLKVQREGFDGLATDALANSKHQLHPESSR